MKIRHLTAVIVALGLPVLGAVAQQDGPPQNQPGGPAQGPDGMPPQGGPGRGMRRPPPPLIAALDANHDGVIDADEIANAPAVLKALDKNNTGKLTMMDLMGPPPRRGGPGQGGPGDGQGPGGPGGPGQGPGGPGGDQGPGAGPDGAPPQGPPQGVANDAAGNGPGGPGRGNRRPMPLIFAALDTNHDGVIDASEMANASAALKTLDKNGDGKLTMDELMGPPPRRGGGPGQGGPGDGQGPGPDGPPGGPGGGQMPPPDQQ